MLLKHAVDNAFDRLTKTYGREFTSKWEGQETGDVKEQWVRDLMSLPHGLDQIAWALRNLPEKAPNGAAFRLLCLRAPSPQQVAMIESKEPVRGPNDDEREAHRALRQASTGARHPSRQWAFDLLDRYERGDRAMSSGALRMACEVAGVVPRETESGPASAITGMRASAIFVDEFDPFYDEEAPRC